MPHAKRNQKNLLTHASHVKRTAIDSMFPIIKCICVLLSLFFVYVFCRITNASKVCGGRIGLKLYILSHGDVFAKYFQLKCHSKREKTSDQFQPVSAAAVSTHVHTPYICLDWQNV